MFRLPYFLVTWTIVLAVPATSQTGQGVAVFDFTSVGVEEPTVMTASELFRQEIRATETFRVMERSAMVEILGENLVCPGAGEAAEMGQALGVEKTIIGKLNRLGEKIIVSISLVSAGTGKVEYSDRLTSLTVEDIETVMERLAQGLATGRPAKETVEVERVTEKEALEPRKRVSVYTTGIKVGLAQPVSGFEGISKGKASMQVLGWYETPEWAAELAFGGAWFDLGKAWADESFTDTWGEISLLKFLSKRDFSPFLGGGMGLHAISVGGSGGTGFGINLNAGVVAFRTYDFRLLGSIRYHLILGQIDEDNMHHMISLEIGLTHPRRERGCQCCPLL